jgi:hypothetical protein
LPKKEYAEYTIKAQESFKDKGKLINCSEMMINILFIREQNASVLLSRFERIAGRS